MPIEAVIFDMDGILVDSEVYWKAVREDFARDHGRDWTMDDHKRAMGRNTIEWAEQMAERLQVGMSQEEIASDIIGRMIAAYRAHMPYRPGALEAVRTIAARYRVGLASGSPSRLIRHVLRETGLDEVFEVTVFGDDIPNGKPAPDIYLEALRQMGVSADRAAGIEDSANGVRSVKAAGMAVVAVPTADFPLPPEVAAIADRILDGMESLSVAVIEGLG